MLIQYLPVLEMKITKSGTKRKGSVFAVKQASFLCLVVVVKLVRNLSWP